MTACPSHNTAPTEQTRKENTHKGFVLMGNLNVGKTTLQAKLKGRESTYVNIPGTTVSIKRGTIRGSKRKIIDTPGLYSLFSDNEDERASRDILLMEWDTSVEGVICVADAKNLGRSLSAMLQIAEYGLPMVLVINMIDEGFSRGIEIDTKKLEQLIGIEVITTQAPTGMGISELISALDRARPARLDLPYPPKLLSYLKAVEHELQPSCIAGRVLGLLLLERDACARKYIEEHWGRGFLRHIETIATTYLQDETAIPEVVLTSFYNREATLIAHQVTSKEKPTKNPFIHTFGELCTKVSTGIPIAVTILGLMYLFVGSFGATFLVDLIYGSLFEEIITPFAHHLIEPLPSAFIRDMIIDPDFGVLPTGIFLAIGLVLPVIFCFYLAFGFLESSGYLPRFSILLDRIFQKMGLNGKGVIPLVMGFSCVTMALLTTRMLNSEKEKNIASFLLFLCMPCAPLIAVMLIILEKMPLSATVFVFGTIFSQILFAGFLANKILPGTSTQLIMEIPVMRVPRLLPIVRNAATKTFFFMKEAVPVFIYASLAIFIFQRIGGLQLLEKTLGPIVGHVMGLPEKSIQVFIKTMIRRESGAAELQHISGLYTNLQLVVNLLVMTFLAPCLNSVIVLFKERGTKAAMLIMGSVFVYAVLLGSVISHVCLIAGIQF